MEQIKKKHRDVIEEKYFKNREGLKLAYWKYTLSPRKNWFKMINLTQFTGDTKIWG